MDDFDITLAGEIGGTFTDIILFEKGSRGHTLRTLKTPSTTKNPEKGLLAGFDRLSPDWEKTGAVLHGSTVGTNAVLERKGVKTAFLVTEGFRDILEIQRGDKENIYDLCYQRSSPLVPRNLVFPVKERISAKGEVLISLNLKQINEIASQLKKERIDAAGICFLHSYLNPVNEQRVKEELQKMLPEIYILISSEIIPQFREYERASTTVMSAYIVPIMSNYIENLGYELEKRKFAGKLFITQSNGGMLPAAAIRSEVIRTLESGPAAGVTGAINIAKQSGLDDIITLDMGGTSTDVCLVNNGKPTVNSENLLNGLPVAVPMIDICSVGAGGGSIAWLDKGGMLRVGPVSSGAQPGPACYNKNGKKVTVTDSHVYRGFIRADNFVGGEFPLNVDASKTVLSELGKECGMPMEDLAEAVIKITTNNMMQAVRVVSTERGNDPRNYTIVAFGGAGPLHAVELADELGISQVLVPRHAGLLSAYGLLVADIIRDYVQTDVRSIGTLTQSDINNALKKLIERAFHEFNSYGYKKEEIVFLPSVELRYQGQAFELEIPIDIDISVEELARLFHETHQIRYGHSTIGEQVEIVNYRLQTKVIRGEENLVFEEKNNGDDSIFKKNVYIDGLWKNCDFVSRKRLKNGDKISGIAIIEEETSTCYIPEGWTAKVLENNSMMITK